MRYADASTSELVAGLHQGEDRAWTELINRYSGRVAATVRTFRLNDADAQDAIQNTWIRALDNIGAIRNPECLPGWLATTASRECIRLVNRRGREVLTGESRDLDRADDESAEDCALRNTFGEWLWDQVDQLPDRHRTLLRSLWSTSSDNYAEAAAATGMPMGSIGPTRRRGLTRMRAALEEQGVTDGSWAS
jgi:RNA polymerase sigma factor (sigma-70 family)